MKILQVSHSFYPCYRAGGVVKVVYEISRALVKRGHDVTVITTDGCIPRLVVKKNTEVEIEGIHVWYFQNISNYLRIKFKIATPFFLPIFLNKQIKNFDVIHIHEHRTILAIIAHHYAKKYRIPYIVQAHGSLTLLSEKQILKKIFDFFWGENILRDASKLIALTDSESSQYIERGVPEKKIEIVPNGIDLSQYSDLPARGKFRSKYQIPENELILLSLGRIHKIKGIDLLITAFSLLCCQMSNVKLVIAGPDGGSLSQIRKQIHQLHLENDVLIIGPLYGKDKLEAYIDADIFILPSRYEAFPNTILEAWASGTPVIATKNCCISDIIRYTDDNVVVEYDHVQMKEKILDLLINEEKRKCIGIKGKQLIKDYFEIAKIIEKIEMIYKTV